MVLAESRKTAPYVIDSLMEQFNRARDKNGFKKLVRSLRREFSPDTSNTVVLPEEKRPDMASKLNAVFQGVVSEHPSDDHIWEEMRQWLTSGVEDGYATSVFRLLADFEFSEGHKEHKQEPYKPVSEETT